MPDAVAQRLNGVVAAENANRAVGSANARGNGDSSSAWEPRPTLGTFGADIDKPGKSRWMVPALAAAAVEEVRNRAGPSCPMRPGAMSA